MKALAKKIERKKWKCTVHTFDAIRCIFENRRHGSVSTIIFRAST